MHIHLDVTGNSAILLVLIHHFYCLLPEWGKFLIEKLTGSQLVNKFATFYGTRRPIIDFTSARHLSLFWARSIKFMLPSYFLKIYLIIILPSTLGSSKWPLFLSFPHQNPVRTSPLPHTCYMPRPSHSSQFDHPNNIWWGVQLIKLLIM